MNDEDRPDARMWEVGWEGHTLAQRRRLARLTLREKLMWLEEAQRLADAMARARRKQSPTDPESETK
jgi:hypothetical protein